MADKKIKSKLKGVDVKKIMKKKKKELGIGFFNTIFRNMKNVIISFSGNSLIIGFLMGALIMTPSSFFLAKSLLPIPEPEIIYQPQEKIVTKHVYKLQLDEQMLMVAKYIRSRNSKMPIEVVERIAFEVVNKSRDTGIPWEITNAIVEKESFFYPSAISTANASGLMQILRAHKIVIDPKQKFDIGYNIDKGIEIFKQKLTLKQANGDLGLALQFYSGNTPGYSKGVLFENMGRLMLFKIKQEKLEKEKIENAKKELIKEKTIEKPVVKKEVKKVVPKKKVVKKKKDKPIKVYVPPKSE